MIFLLQLSLMTDITDLTKNLTEARRAKAWSQKEVADKLNMKQSQISDIEAGKRDLRLSTLVDVARTVGLEVVLVPRQLLPAVSYVLKSTSAQKQEEQQSMYESWNEE
jgi:HTH-type transcriptional regulator/antitoxin HipB